jgi:hypothetical protein
MSRPISCRRCGDPLPVDRQCDCKGSDIDQIAQLAELKHTKILTIKGPMKTYPVEETTGHR